MNNKSFFIHSVGQNKDLTTRLASQSLLDTLVKNTSSILSINKFKVDRDTEIVFKGNKITIVSNKKVKSFNLFDSTIELSVKQLDYTTENDFTSSIINYVAVGILNLTFSEVNGIKDVLTIKNEFITLSTCNGKGLIRNNQNNISYEFKTLEGAKLIYLNTLKQLVKL